MTAHIWAKLPTCLRCNVQLPEGAKLDGECSPTTKTFWDKEDELFDKEFAMEPFGEESECLTDAERNGR